MPRGRKKATTGPQAEPYTHKASQHPVRPDIGVQAQFKQQKPPVTYRYDKSLDPSLSWDPKADRDYAERLIYEIEELAEIAGRADVAAEERAAALARLRSKVAELRAMSRPLLDWTGKAERPEFTVPTLPLFVHERLSTQAILESVRGKKRSKAQQLDLFADPGLDIADRILKAYEHQAPWTNRLILGDSLLVMNSLLEYEGLGGKVQMIYMDPPYGVRFNSNFQPFVRKREVKHNDDKDLTREPEMVRAYRDTWELGLHSYLTYLRDRL
ncbi:MAG: site-specific DNA-methyltransferase, partial [Anaerolineae bacterium]|nr:site-specific DNA-methyltransferase [Anaerolineae bacterium]